MRLSSEQKSNFREALQKKGWVLHDDRIESPSMGLHFTNETFESSSLNELRDSYSRRSREILYHDQEDWQLRFKESRDVALAANESLDEETRKILYDTSNITSIVRGFQENRPDQSLDKIYECIDTCLQEGKFKAVNEALLLLDAPSLPTDALLGVLTCVSPVRSKLEAHKDFFNEVKSTLAKRGEDAASLLKGLESMS